MRHSEIIADLPGDLGRRAWGQKYLSRLERKIEEFNKMMLQTFDEHFVRELYTVTYHVLVDKVEKCKMWKYLERYSF